jgi:hypothetical protein
MNWIHFQLNMENLSHCHCYDLLWKITFLVVYQPYKIHLSLHPRVTWDHHLKHQNTKLVGGDLTILKNHGVRQWEGWHPIYEMENKIHVWNHQPGINMIKYAPIRPIHIISEVFLRSWWVNSHFPTSNSAARYSPEPARRLAQQDSAATARAQLGFDLDLGLQVSR